MRKRIAALCLTLLLLCGGALADGALQPGNAFWIIADSDTRLLTEDELWRYTRETLRYIRNEILARCGYAFETVKFYNYFNAKPWYSAGGYQTARKLSSVAWSNVDTVKAVEKAMDKRGTANEGGIDISRIIAYQNGMGGYGDMLSYGNSRGVGGGLTLAENDPAYRDPQPFTTPVWRSTPMPNYCFNAEYIIPDSDIRPLTEGELWAYSRETLRYIRNELLARHGYTFKNDKFAEYFGGKSWYTPGGYSDSLLSSLEWTNVDLVKQVEREMDELGVDNAHYLDIQTIVENQKIGRFPG